MPPALHLPFTPRDAVRTGLTPLALAVHVAFAATLVLSAPNQVVAQAAAQAIQYDIPAGPLSEALNRYAQQSGVAMVVDASLLQGLRAPALKGRYDIDTGFGVLLRDSGYVVSRTPAGYVLRPAPAIPAASVQPNAAVLPAITVTASSERDTRTEGSGEYATTVATTSATGLALTQRETPQAISIVTRQRIEDQALVDVKDAVRATPGLSIQEMGSERYNIQSRNYAITSIQYDGLQTYSDIATQETPQNFADLAVFDRVETLRGATGLLSGAGDPSGTVNLIRKRPTATPQGSIGVTLGSWDKKRVDADVSGPLNAAGTLRGRLVGVHQDNEQFVDYAHEKKTILYGVLEADLSPDTLLTAGIDYQTRKARGTTTNVGWPLYDSTGQQITDLPRSLNPAARDNLVDSESATLFASLSQRLQGDWKIKLSAQRLQHTSDFDTRGAATWSGFFNRATGTGVGIYEWDGDSTQYQNAMDANVSGPFELFGRKHDLVAGVNYLKYSNKTYYDALSRYGVFNPYTWDGLVTATPSVRKPRNSDTTWNQRGAYLATRLNPTDALHVIAGMRWGKFSNSYSEALVDGSYRNSIGAADDGKLTPYLGVVYDLSPQHAVYASLTSIYMPQQYRDRDGNYLDPRTGKNYEIGLKSSFLDERVNTAVSAYRIRENNLAVADGGFMVPGSTSSAYRAVQGADTSGVEFEVNGEVLPRLNLAASYSYQQTEDSQGTRIKTYLPRQTAKLWATYRLPDSRFTLGAGMRWQSAISYVFAPWQLNNVKASASASSYTVADMMLRYEISKETIMTLNVYNVFDKKYLSSIDTVYNTGYYGTPRSVSLNLRHAF